MQSLFHVAVRLHIQQHLRRYRHSARQLAQRLAGQLHYPHQLNGGKLSVSGRHIFPKNDMSRLLAADVVAVFTHILQHITVAHLGGLGVNPILLCKAEKAEAAHHRYHGSAAGKPALSFHLPCKNSDHLVAVDHIALFVHGKTAVGIAVKGNCQIVFAAGHQACQMLHMGAAARPIDVGAVGGIAQYGRLGAQEREQQPCGTAGSAVGAVRQHPHTVQPLRYGGGKIFSIKRCRLVVLGADTDLLRLHRDQGDIPIQKHSLDLVLLVIGQLVALRSEDLDAVEFIGIVGGGNNHARRRLFLHGKVSHRRRGNDPQQHHIGTARHQSAGKRRLQHITGKSGIPSDDHGRALAGVLRADHLRQRHTHLSGTAKGKIAVGNAANAVCSKQSAHIVSSRFLNQFWFRRSSGNAPKWGGCGGSAAGRPPPFWAVRCCE